MRITVAFTVLAGLSIAAPLSPVLADNNTPISTEALTAKIDGMGYDVHRLNRNDGRYDAHLIDRETGHGVNAAFAANTGELMQASLAEHKSQRDDHESRGDEHEENERDRD